MSPRDIFKKASSADKARSRREAINKTNMHGTNAFFSAIEKGNLSLVRQMVEDGADIGARTTARGMMSNLMVSVPYAVGATPLHAACMLGASDIVGFLLEKGANPNATDKEDHTPMDYALLSFGFYRDDLERREKSYFTTQNKMQKTADKLHDFEQIVALLRAHDGKPGMFEVPDALQFSPMAAQPEDDRIGPPKKPAVPKAPRLP